VCPENSTTGASATGCGTSTTRTGTGTAQRRRQRGQRGPDVRGVHIEAQRRPGIDPGGVQQRAHRAQHPQPRALVQAIGQRQVHPATVGVHVQAARHDAVVQQLPRAAVQARRRRRINTVTFYDLFEAGVYRRCGVDLVRTSFANAPGVIA
jgi:hypothetical protein